MEQNLIISPLLISTKIPDTFRIVTDGDIVAGVPSWGYKHVGTEVVVDGNGSGSLVIDPSFMERYDACNA